MSFTEIAFELGDPKHPLCRATRAPSASHAVYRVLDAGDATRRHRAHVLFHGPAEAASDLALELRAGRPDVSVEIVHQTPAHAGLFIEAPPEAGAGLAALGAVLQAQGGGVVVDPVVATEGRLRARFVVLREVDTQQVLRLLQDVQRSTGMAEFRVIRISNVDPTSYVEMARRALPPEHEQLLALAASMGYYETPKVVTLEAISRAVGLSISPVHKRLKAAEEAIVGQHVQIAPAELGRRRARGMPTGPEAVGPWEMVVRVSRADIGPAGVVATRPGVRAYSHVLCEDNARGHAQLVVLVGPEEAQARLLASLEGRSDVAHAQVLSRSGSHVAVRVGAREPGAWSLSWWCDAWAGEAWVRGAVYDGDDAFLRVLLLRPQPMGALQKRLAECAQAAGWGEWEIASLRQLSAGARPPLWPEPLTQRQLEVLRVAHALGYYRTPRACTLESVAKTLGVSANAIHKNLVLAESKLIAAYLAAGL